MNHEIVFEKINQALSESQFDALVISGADNFLYFTGTSLQHLYSQKNLPFFIFWKKGTDPVCVCPAIWESTFKKISSITTILAYPISADNIKLAADKLAELIQNNTAGGNTVGLDL